MGHKTNPKGRGRRNAAKSLIDEVLGVDPRGTLPDVKRSGKWPKVEREHLSLHPACAVCGRRDRVNAHHVLPYHLWPEHELDPENLITLCVEPHDCHLLFGHLGDFKAYNPTVRADAEIMRYKLSTAKAILRILHARAKGKA
jgi:hypothetical protein